MWVAGVYVHAIFELVSGVMFFIDAGALHNDFVVGSGFPKYLVESAGIGYAFWGALLLVKAGDVTIQLFDAAYCLAYFLFLGRFYLNQAGSSMFDNGSWAIVPIAVKGVCGVCALAAASASASKEKGALKAA